MTRHAGRNADATANQKRQ